MIENDTDEFKKGNSYDDEDEDIDMELLETKSNKELIRVAKSLKLKPNGKKSEIIERIKKFIKESKNSKQELSKHNLINKFNSNIYQLPIRDIEKQEELFWKVFKNKILFKEIFKFLNCKYHSYDDLIYIDWMLDNGYLNLLKDKIKRNQPIILFFNNYNIQCKWYSNIFVKIKQQKEFLKIISTPPTTTPQPSPPPTTIVNENNKEFFESLFKNYSKYFVSLRRVLKELIVLGIFQGFQILIDNSYCSFESNKNGKSREYLLAKKLVLMNRYSRLKMFRYFWEVYIEREFTNDKSKIKETLLSIIEKESRGYFDCSNPPKRFKFLNYLLESGIIQKNLFKQLFEKHLENINGQQMNKLTINDLIHYFHSISHINNIKKDSNKNKNNNNNNINNNNNNNDSDEFNLILSTINEIKSSLSKSQLKLQIKLIIPILLNYIIDQGNNDYQIIINNIKKLVYFCEEKGPIHRKKIQEMEMKLIFNLDFNLDILKPNHPSQISGDIKYFLINSLENGNYGLLKFIVQNYGDSKVLPIIYTKFKSISNHGEEYPNLLFANCPSEKQRIQFINEAINDHKNNKNRNEWSSLAVFTLFYLLISYDDLELLEIAIKGYGGEDFLLNNVFNDGCTHIIKLLEKDSLMALHQKYLSSFSNFHRHIKSIRMLDYCFKNLNNFFKKVNDMVSWYSLGRIDLLERFEQLLGITNDHNKSNTDLLLPFSIYYIFDESCSGFERSNLVKTAAYIVKKPIGIYQYSEDALTIYIDINKNQRLDIDDVITIISKTNRKMKLDGDGDYDKKNHYVNSNKVKLINWIYNYRYDDLKSGRFTITNGYYVGLFISNKLNNSCSIKSICSNDEINNQWIFKNNYSKTLSDVEDLIYSPTIYDKVIIELLDWVEISGDIDLLSKLLKEYYFPLFDSNNDPRNCKENTKQTLFNFLMNVIKRGWLKIIQHLFYDHQCRRVLTKKLSRNNSIFNQRELNSLLEYAIHWDQFYIADFFINRMGFKISQNQLFNAIERKYTSSKLSVVYNLFK
ncbi:hypothetical protein ACTFIV_007270 [Dictyostelium citrinum]